MHTSQMRRPVEILLVEDNPGDARLAKEAFNEGRIPKNVNIAADGVEAMAFLRREGKYANAPKPDLIMLDLNLPKKDGREVVAEIKTNEQLRRVPVVVLTTSEAETDVVRMYDLHVNCYIVKPVDLNQFFHVVKAIEDFWVNIVKLPQYA